MRSTLCPAGPWQQLLLLLLLIFHLSQVQPQPSAVALKCVSKLPVERGIELTQQLPSVIPHGRVAFGVLRCCAQHSLPGCCFWLRDIQELQHCLQVLWQCCLVVLIPQEQQLVPGEVC